MAWPKYTLTAEEQRCWHVKVFWGLNESGIKWHVLLQRYNPGVYFRLWKVEELWVSIHLHGPSALPFHSLLYTTNVLWPIEMPQELQRKDGLAWNTTGRKRKAENVENGTLRLRPPELGTFSNSPIQLVACGIMSEKYGITSHPVQWL